MVFPNHRDFNIDKTKALLFTLLVVSIFNPFIYSCSPRMTIGGQSKYMPSAYTGTGKYIKYNGIGKKHNGIKQYTLKCRIPPAPKK
jgi:hypothetical protein